MPLIRIIGLVALALGAVLLVFAWRGANAPVDQLTDAVSGQYTDRTMWTLYAGIAAVVAGVLLALFGKRLT